MAVKYDGISESSLNSLNDQEVVSRAKQKLKSDLEAGMVSIDQAMELVNNMKTIEQMSPESNVPQYSMSTLSKIKAAYDKPYIEAQKAAEKAAKAAQSSSKSSKSKDEEEAEAEALYQKMMGGENAQASTNSNSASASTKTDNSTEKEEPEEEKGFLAKAADWLKNTFSIKDNYQESLKNNASQSQREGTALPGGYALGSKPAQTQQKVSNAVNNAVKKADQALLDLQVAAVRQNAIASGKSKEEAASVGEEYRKGYELERRQNQYQKQIDALRSERWEADYSAMMDDLSKEDQDAIKQLAILEQMLDTGITGGYQKIQNTKTLRNSYRDSLLQHGVSESDLDELVRYQRKQNDDARTAQEIADRIEYVNQSGTNATLASAISVIEGTYGNVQGFVDTLEQKADRVLNDSPAPIHTNSQSQLAANRAEATRQQVSGNIADKLLKETGNEFIAQLAANGYQLALSGADSLITLPLGAGATVVLGTSAANQSFKQAKAQGATDNQALAYGVLAGIAEGLFEKYSLDNVKAMARTDKKGFNNFVLNSLKSMGVEGSEEMLTQIANDFAETLILAENSNQSKIYDEAYNYALSQGLNDEDARAIAKQAQADELYKSWAAATAGGAFMGGVIGGGAQLAGKAVRGVKNRFGGQGATPSPEMQTGTESVLPSLNDQTVQETENLSGTGALGQDAEQALPALGDPAPMNDSSGNQEVTFILQKMASGQTLSGKEVETLIQGENRKSVETALGTTLPETKSAARRFVRDLEAKAQAGVADNSEHAEANLPGLQEPIDQQEIPGYTETEMSTGGAGNGYAGAERIPGMDENAESRIAEAGASVVRGRASAGGNQVLRGFLNPDENLNQAVANTGATPLELRDTTSDPQLFSSSLEAARQNNPHGLMVSGKSVEELSQPGTVTFMSPDNMAGALVTADGDIEAVFKNPKSAAKGAGSSLLLNAINNGGTKLDCYGQGLVTLYNKHGFVPVAKVKWNPEYAPEGWSYGPKDVYVMKLANGVGIQEVIQRLGLSEEEGGFHIWSQKELDALPEMDYDEALAYRDSLIQNTQNAKQRLPGLGDDLTGTATNPSVGAADRGFGGEVKKSKVASNTMTNTGLIEDGERAELGLDEEDSYVYQVAKNDDSVKAAAERLNADFEGAVNDLNQKQDEWTAQDTDTAMLAVSKLLHGGKTAEAQRLLRNLQGHSTEAGQAIQALAKYTHTGEYAIAKGLKILESNGQQWKKENRRESAKLDDIAQNLMDFASKEDASESGNMDDEFSEFVRRGGMEPLQTAAKRIEQKGLTLEQMEAELRKLIEKSSLKDSTKKRLKDDVVKEIAKRALNGATVRELSSLFDNYLANGLFEFDDATVGQIMELYEKAGNERNGSREQAKYQDEAVGLIASKIGKTSFADKLNMYRYWSMLSSPKTLIKNEFGNIAMGHITQTKAAVKSVLEKVYSHFDKDYTRTTTLLNYASKADQALLKATATDADAVSYQNLTGGGSRFKPESVQRSTQFFARADNETGVKGAVKRGVNKVISSPGNTLERMDYSGLSGINALKKLGISEDRFLASPLAQAGLRNQYKFALARYLKANKIDSSVFSLEQRVEANPNMKLTAQEKSSLEALRNGREYAVREAKQATFHDQNALANLLNGFVDSAKKQAQKGEIDFSDEVSSSQIAKLIGMGVNAMIPFRTTTSNIVARGVEYSPLGFVNAIMDGTKFKRGPEKVLDDLAKAMTGSGLAVLGYILAKAGWVTGSGDDDSNKNKFDEMQGKQNYSINLPGGGSYEIGFTAPASIPFFIGAEMADGEMTLGDGYDLIANAMSPLFDNTLLSSMSAIFDAGKYADSEQGVLGAVGTQAVANYGNQLVPSLAKQIGRAAQDTRRSSYTQSTGPKGTLDYNAQRMVNWLPGLGEPYIDAWGREQENVGGNFAGKLAYNVLSPGYYSPGNSTEVDKELEALYEATGDSGVLPSLADKTYGSDKTRFTEEEYTDYAKIRGQTAYDLIEELTDSVAFNQLEDGDKAELVKSLYGLAGAVGKEKVVGLQPTSSSNKKLYEAYLERGTAGAVSYALATSQIVPTGKESETTGERGTTKEDLYRAYFGTSESVQNQAQNYLTKANDKKATAAYQQFGASAVKEWVRYSATADLDKNGSISQTEAKVWLNHSNLTQAQKAWFWQNTNSQWEKRNNPFI